MNAKAQAACTVPNTLINGQTADATQVMANFDSVMNCVNTAPAGSTNALQYNAGTGTFGGIGPLTNGQIAIGSTGNAPQAAQLTAGTGITITTGPGSVMISGAATPYTRPQLSEFTWGNQPTGTTAADTSTGLAMLEPSQSDSDNWAQLWQNAPYPPSPVSFIIGTNATLGLVSQQYYQYGIIIGDDSGKFVSLEIDVDINNKYNLAISHWTNPSSFNVDSYTTMLSSYPNFPFLAIEDDGTNFTFYAGADRNSLIKVYSESRTSFLSTPSKIGLGIDATDYAKSGLPLAATFFDYETISGAPAR